MAWEDFKPKIRLTQYDIFKTDKPSKRGVRVTHLVYEDAIRIDYPDGRAKIIKPAGKLGNVRDESLLRELAEGGHLD